MLLGVVLLFGYVKEKNQHGVSERMYIKQSKESLTLIEDPINAARVEKT